MLNDKVKALVVVEGEKAEKTFFESLAAVFDLNFRIVPFKANIYDLCSTMMSSDYSMNIVDILIDKYPEMKDELSLGFAYIYLVFDLDPQHHNSNEELSPVNLFLRNVEIIKHLASHCIDETDPTLGKLYVNYPMFESFRCCDSFFDENYKSENIELDQIKSFKSYCSGKRLSGISLDKYSICDFNNITRMNIFKLNYMLLDQWGYFVYSEYINNSNQLNVLNRQIEMYKTIKEIAVLNTSVFILLDYYGKEFYDKLFNCSNC